MAVSVTSASLREDGQRINKDQQPNEHLEAIEAAASPDTYTKPSRRTWYRTSFFNITIVSICAFIAPGLWAAINGLGAGGAASPYCMFYLPFLVAIMIAC